MLDQPAGGFWPPDHMYDTPGQDRRGGGGGAPRTKHEMGVRKTTDVKTVYTVIMLSGTL